VDKSVRIFLYISIGLLVLVASPFGYGIYDSYNSRKQLVEKAENGDARILSEVGNAFSRRALETGFLGETNSDNKDYKMAKKYYRLAAEKGDIDAIVGFARIWCRINTNMESTTPNSLDRAKVMSSQEKQEGREVIGWLEKAHSTGIKFDIADLTQAQLILAGAVSYSGGERAYKEALNLLRKVYKGDHGPYLRAHKKSMRERKFKELVARKIAFIYERDHIEGWPKFDEAGTWRYRAGQRSRAKELFHKGWKHFQKSVTEKANLDEDSLSKEESLEIEAILKSWATNLVKASLLGDSESGNFIKFIEASLDPMSKTVISRAKAEIKSTGIAPKLKD
jgi:TPR repeat protein